MKFVISTAAFPATIFIRLMLGAIFMSSMFLLIRGGGLWSLDNAIEKRRIKREIYGTISEESIAG